MARRHRANPRRQCRLPQPATVSPASGKQKSLLDLPLEIRNSIYDLALMKDKLFDDDDHDIHYKRYKIREPGLLRACKQIRNETLSVFYGANTFRCSNMHCTLKFLGTLSPRKLAALRTVHGSVHTTEEVYEGYLESLKAVVRRLVEVYGRSSLHLDAIRIQLRIRGEPKSRYVSCYELEGYQAHRSGHREVILPK